MTPAEWKEVAQILTFPGATVTLQCDTFRVDLVVMREDMRLIICPFVDGYMKVQNVTTDCEERRRFARPVLKKPRPFKPAEVRNFGKRWCQQFIKDHTRTVYRHEWPSVPPMRRHFTKHNGTITWIKKEETVIASPRLASDRQSAELVQVNLDATRATEAVS